jgi:hypothetical protein
VATDAIDSLSSTHRGWRLTHGEDSLAGACLRVTQVSAALNNAMPPHSNCSGNVFVFCAHTIHFIIKIDTLWAKRGISKQLLRHLLNSVAMLALLLYSLHLEGYSPYDDKKSLKSLITSRKIASSEVTSCS